MPSPPFSFLHPGKIPSTWKWKRATGGEGHSVQIADLSECWNLIQVFAFLTKQDWNKGSESCAVQEILVLPWCLTSPALEDRPYLDIGPMRVQSITALQTQGMVVTGFKSSALTAYKKSYQKRGTRDHHEKVFASLSKIIDPPDAVLYPGCHRHITPSLVFPKVDYVDSESKVGNVYEDSVVRDWVLSETTNCDKHPDWTFTCASYATKIPNISLESYDLLISLSAGIISEPCSQYIKPGGFLLVNDGHADASIAFVNDKVFKLYAVWDDGQWKTSDLTDYFRTTEGSTISKDQAKEAVEIGTKSKRSFRLKKEVDFYLFQKQSSDGVEGEVEIDKSEKPLSKRPKLS
eukprot:scaffold25665_cov113-Cylindrotheca_fusiformis.AAC.4